MAYFLRFCASEATLKRYRLGNPIPHDDSLGYSGLANRFNDYWLISISNGNIAFERSERLNPLANPNTILGQNSITFHCPQSRYMRMKYPTIKITFEPLDKRTMIYLAIIIRMR